MKFMSKLLIVITMVGAVFAAGCQGPSLNRSDAKAGAGAPEVAEVEIKEIPYDENYPIYVVYVEDLEYGASGTTSGGAEHSWEGPNRQVGAGMSAQLGTALDNCGNIVLIEKEALRKGADGTYSCKLEKGEVGPFIIKGTVTEFSETADLSEKKKGGSFGFVGVIASLVGIFTDNNACVYGGAGVAAANPTFEKKEMKRSGMVAMDLKIIKGSNNRRAGSFKCAGTFTTMSASSGMSLFGIGKGGNEFAASALGQATRAAMNDAIEQVTKKLKKNVPGADSKTDDAS